MLRIVDENTPRHRFRMPIREDGVDSFAITVRSTRSGTSFVNGDVRARHSAEFHNAARILRWSEDDETRRALYSIYEQSCDARAAAFRVSIQSITDRCVGVLLRRRTLDRTATEKSSTTRCILDAVAIAMFPRWRRGKERTVIVIDTHLRREADLPQVAHVLHDARAFLHAGVGRQCNGSEHRDHRDDDGSSIKVNADDGA